MATSNSTRATSEAVKSVISAAKGSFSGQFLSVSPISLGILPSSSTAKGNKLTRINLTVSPKGIEIVDRVSGETLQQISIYRISYCSADSTHNNVFAFISSAPSTSGDGQVSQGEDNEFAPPTGESSADAALTCHVFLCSKRKMAQNISLTVAKSFERAFEIWKSISHRRLISAARQTTPRYDSSPTPRPDTVTGSASADEDEEQTMNNLLIDLNADLTDIRKSYLQNTWVSFEETEHLMSNLQKNAICS